MNTDTTVLMDSTVSKSTDSLLCSCWFANSHGSQGQSSCGQAGYSVLIHGSRLMGDGFVRRLPKNCMIGSVALIVGNELLFVSSFFSHLHRRLVRRLQRDVLWRSLAPGLNGRTILSRFSFKCNNDTFKSLIMLIIFNFTVD